MARYDSDLYWVQIDQHSYPTIAQLIHSRALQPYHGSLSGPLDAQVWRVAPGHLEVQSDQSVSIAGMEVVARVARQPSHAYCAMVSASPTFAQYVGVDHLYQLLRTHEGWDPSLFAAALEASVRWGRVTLPSPLLATRPTTYDVRWLPDQSYVARQGNGHHMLGLSYAVHYLPPAGLVRRYAVGLDLGIDPLTAVRVDTGQTLYFRPTPLTHARTLPALSAQARQVLQALIYASGRADGERVIAWLVTQAHTVYAERLRHRGMSSHWIHNGRDHAIHDHHYSALSQYLYAAGVEFRRVASHHTSLICAPCLEQRGVAVQGHRSGHDFSCPSCGQSGNAHANAAHNVLLRGQMLAPRGRAA